MPELPEVESVRRSLVPHLLGEKIRAVTVYWRGAAHAPEGLDFAAALTAAEVGGLRRRAKYLLIDLADGALLLAHLRMTGRLVFYEKKKEPDKHTHIIISFTKGELHFHDVRKFGRLEYLPPGYSEPSCLASLGPEPLTAGFSPEVLAAVLKGRKTLIKSALLNQQLISGLGNIYADEALFGAGIAPEREALSLSTKETVLLAQEIEKVLSAGIAAGGTTFRDYVDADGKRGNYAKSLRVYGRKDKPCLSCGTTLARVVIGGRGSVYCPHCQH
jgi:formamidopyrimidine-DNA glycosylase